MAAITFDKVTKRFDDGFEAVKQLDLEIEDGEFVILVGPSGCGKSTALRMIAGLEDVTEGAIRIDDEDVTDRAPKDRDVAMVFQSYALYPHMTVRQNMEFPLKLAKLDKEEIAKRVDEAAGVLDLEAHLDRKPGQLSGGQRQRVAMGRALVRDPKAFLMDEPLSNLDAKLRVQMRTEVARIQHRAQTTTVYVTHDQTEAMTLGDRVAVMRAGVLQQVGPPKELYEEPTNLFVASFIGSPSMNLVMAHLEGDKLALPFAQVPIGGAQRRALEQHDGDDVIVGIRPEHIEDAALEPEWTEFEAPIDVIESMGSELYVYFTFEGGDVESEELAELHAASGTGEMGGTKGQAVARLSAESTVQKNQTAKLALDPDRLHLFDPQSGKALR
ncbi:MAG TPA: sn-glycerol-3-phosphate ABC transporter ATP-binding protein UgpC [Baekduia sp.]|nr:sn-glycerol-3-phosphate ABC transporter ATP-binding protein UgpC [Baekduia sp.]